MDRISIRGIAAASFFLIMSYIGIVGWGMRRRDGNCGRWWLDVCGRWWLSGPGGVASPVARIGECGGECRLGRVGSLLADVRCWCRRPPFGTFSFMQELNSVIIKIVRTEAATTA